MSNSHKVEEISGRIESVVYRNEENDYTVMEISNGDMLVTAVGIIPMAFEGERVVLRGTYTFHKEFGRQFSFDSFEKSLPEEVEDILHYLSSRTIKGVGPVTALKIVNKFGTESFDVIENHPEWLAHIPGITLNKAKTISESFRQQTDMRGVVMFCRNYMGIGEATRVYKKLGAGAVGIMKTNPYVLCDEEIGLSFEKTDEIALSLGQAKDSVERIFHGIKYILSYNAITNGHTCLPVEKLLLAAQDLLELGSEKIKTVFSSLIESGELCCEISENGRFVMTKETMENENLVAEKIISLDNEAVIWGMDDISGLLDKIQAKENICFAPLQREALFSAMRCGVMILTGGPGTGKTTVIKALISIFNSLGQKVVLAAPTGRAAKRMSEATGEEAKTVHRLLEMERSLDGSTRFARNEKNPVSENVVIVDEASMLDLSLTAALLRALKRRSRLIFIGDRDQLPSVGAGNVFSDLIESEKIKTIRLTEIFRQSKESLIITNAHKINEGEAPVLNVTDKDFFFVRRENEEEIPQTIASLVLERLPKTYGADIKEQIQIITPSRKGVGGVENLNATLQGRINPPGKFKKEKNAHGVVFREGDRVMQVANNYDIEWERYGITGVGLFNGDIGLIQKMDLINESMTICFDDKLVEYPFGNLDELELAYAITVHKSQGSEYPVVIIPMYYCAPMLMTRNLLYTAVTRAKKMVILVGKSSVPQKMVVNNSEILRYTTLKEKILKY